ncbi:unnamed protein product [Albugo candida]|uniref:RxLR effector protein n=1 Tax=Albugo candida TaxID=65357 RepID=A0A024FW55_9STRA|nr:unnamed protein product [Albugo candida]|eukprot:CCI11388.1 unnamed protein product [Albugo candida]
MLRTLAILLSLVCLHAQTHHKALSNTLEESNAMEEAEPHFGQVGERECQQSTGTWNLGQQLAHLLTYLIPNRQPMPQSLPPEKLKIEAIKIMLESVEFDPKLGLHKSGPLDDAVFNEQVLKLQLHACAQKSDPESPKKDFCLKVGEAVYTALDDIRNLLPSLSTMHAIRPSPGAVMAVEIVSFMYKWWFCEPNPESEFSLSKFFSDTVKLVLEGYTGALVINIGTKGLSSAISIWAGANDIPRARRARAGRARSTGRLK